MVRRRKKEAASASRHCREPIKELARFLRGSKKERIKAYTHIFKCRPDSLRKNLAKQIMKVPTPNKNR